MSVTINDRTTKYITSVRRIIHSLGHATNAEILEAMHLEYPQLSATTVHRITARMLERGEVQLAPSGQYNVLRFDANTKPHDHFMCQRCELLRDTYLGALIRGNIENLIGDGCSISGSLTVSGLCNKCKREEIL